MPLKPICPPTRFSVWLVINGPSVVRRIDSAWKSAKLAHARAEKLGDLGNDAAVEELLVWTDPEAQEEDSKT